MKRYRLAVCKGPDCKRNGADAVFAAARAGVAARPELSGRVEVYRGGCYGLCHLGANVVVREDTGRKRDPFSREDFQLMGWDGECHYGEMTAEKMERVVAEHLAKDAPVTELLSRDS